MEKMMSLSSVEARVFREIEVYLLVESVEQLRETLRIKAPSVTPECALKVTDQIEVEISQRRIFSIETEAENDKVPMVFNPEFVTQMSNLLKSWA